MLFVLNSLRHGNRFLAAVRFVASTESATNILTQGSPGPLAMSQASRDAFRKTAGGAAKVVHDFPFRGVAGLSLRFHRVVLTSLHHTTDNSG